RPRWPPRRRRATPPSRRRQSRPAPRRAGRRSRRRRDRAWPSTGPPRRRRRRPPPPREEPREPQATAAASSQTPVKVPASAVGYGAPSKDEMTDALKAAANRYAPELPPGLTWGYFDKARKQLYVFCSTCKQYVDVIKFNMNTNTFEAEDGCCPHWTGQVKGDFYSQARKAAGV
ncbi:unnamed protein product, partial [Prorocentrum cordatum]